MSIFELIFKNKTKRLEIAREFFVALKDSPIHRSKMQELIAQISKKTGKCKTTVQIVLKDLRIAGMIVYIKPNYNISPIFINKMNQSWNELILGAKQ